MKPDLGAGQNLTRHYSETFSRETALWFRKKAVQFELGSTVLKPEGKVDTIYGKGNRGKSLDIAALSPSGYLTSNISIK